MTPLDEAYLAALDDQSKAGVYYNLFMRSDIFIPTHDKPDTEGSHRASADETFNPVILDNDDSKILLLFDTLERLQNFAPNELGYIVLPGHAVLESMPGGMNWLLNHGSDNPKEFSPNETAFLKRQFDQNGPDAVNVTEGTRVMVGTPAKVPDGLVEVLSNACARNPEIVTAYLGQIFIDAPGEVPHLALVVKTTGVDEQAKAALMTDLTVAAHGKLVESDQLELLVDQPGQMTDGIVQEVQPFYRSE
jgi:hypothetical protein